MRSNRDNEARRRRWSNLRAIGEFVATLLLMLLVIISCVILPGFLTDSASTVGASAVRAAQR